VVEPEEYDLELSADSPLSEEDLDNVAKIAEDRGLTKEQATNLLKNMEKAYSTGAAKALETSRLENAEMKKQLISDPLFNSKEKIVESLGKINNVLVKFGGENRAELIKLFKGPAGNNLHLAKLLISIANAGADDTVITPKNPGNTIVESDRTKQLRETYPSFFEKKD